MRIYVASGSKDLERARRVMAALRAAGWVISHDWTDGVLAARADGYGSDAVVPDERANTCADADVAGVRTCDVFLLLRSEPTTFGHPFEAGVANEHNVRRIVVGSRAPIFLRSWDHYETDEAAVAALGGVL